MLTFIKKNKLLSILVFMTIITLFLGILLPSVIDDNTKKEIKIRVQELEKNIQEGKTSSKLGPIILNKSLTTFFIWVVGISVIGIPILIWIYLTQVLLVSSEGSFLFLFLKQKKVLFSTLYLVPQTINTVIYFLLVDYAIQYSIFLIQLLFGKKEGNIHLITKKYLKIGIISILLMILNSLLEIYLLPELLKIFI